MKIIQKSCFVLLAVLWLQNNLFASNIVKVKFPFEKSEVSLEIQNGELYCSVKYADKQALDKSKSGMVLTEETTRVLVTCSGLAVLPGSPESYESKSDLFECIAHMPITWDDTRIINSEIGKFITTARRSDDKWFIASNCDEEGVTLPVLLDFF